MLKGRGGVFAYVLQEDQFTSVVTSPVSCDKILTRRWENCAGDLGPPFELASSRCPVLGTPPGKPVSQNTPSPDCTRYMGRLRGKYSFGIAINIEIANVEW